MYELINRAVIPVINEGGVSFARLENLIYVKEFVDRISTQKFVNDTEVLELQKKYGVKPDIITWGDYFQSEFASRFCRESDQEFLKAVDTVKFDMIASYLIFHEKGSEFFEWVRNSYYNTLIDDHGYESSEVDEIRHLKILMDYYLELGIADRFDEAEMSWYADFKEEDAAAM
ncbi:MAG: hypothetical protein WDA74_04890 [Spirochaetota bacterium]